MRLRKLKSGYRSKLEEFVAAILKRNKIPFKYESRKISFIVPATNHYYLPDFDCGDYLIEAKGHFDRAARRKMQLVKQQHPDLRIILLFGNSRNRIEKGSRTTYAMWAENNGYEWIDLKDWKLNKYDSKKK